MSPIRNRNSLQIKLIRLVILPILALLVGNCKGPEHDQLFNLLDPKHTGITFKNELVSDFDMNILEYLYFYNGGGVAIGDINNDGLPDIYFTSNQGENKLYLNLGNLQFEDITAAAGVIGGGGWSTGATMADVNGDGLLDIYVCQVGDYKTISGKNRLYINNGDLTFTDQAALYGVDFVGFSTQALFFDYDQDGDLDLYLLNHSIKKPEVFSHADTKYEQQDEKGGDKLYKNLLAEGGSGMQDVTQEAGILSSSLGFGLGVGIADVNGDGWMDIYISNDFTEDDYLYLNQGDGTFQESLKTFISNTSRYSMGNDLADINNDGLPDIFTTDMLPQDPTIWMKSLGEDKQEVIDVKKRLGYGDQFVRNHLQLNSPSGMFSEIGLLSGTSATDWSWSPLIFDMDNDGLKDIHITNGIVKRPNDLDFVQYSQSGAHQIKDEELSTKILIDMLPTMKLANFAYKNLGNLEFANMAKEWGLDQETYSNGSAYADLDNDGDLDLVINNIDQVAFVYENRSNTLRDHRFVQFDLKSNHTGNSFGIGATVTVFAQGQQFHQTLSTSRGFQSGVSTTLTFGLGKISSIDSVLVNWSRDATEKYVDISLDQKHLLLQGTGAATDSKNPASPTILEHAEVDLPWRHLENTEFDEFRREYLMPKRFGMAGPALAVGDLNGDGLEDLYLGGAKNQPGVVFFQNSEGKFTQQQNPIFDQLKASEEVVAEIIDLNGDGHPDLYVGSGGNEHPTGQLFLFDKVFLNDGKGNLHFSPTSLPPIGENTGAIAFEDVNGDGYPDLFVGSAVVTGDYGASPRSFLLLNDGSGKFSDATSSYFGSDFRPGMVHTAIWADIMGDAKPELIIGGHWMPIQVYSLEKNQFKKVSPQGIEYASGWVNRLFAYDLDGNGYEDIIVGNLGLNSKLKASQDYPIWLYHADFDSNGQGDPLIFHYMEGRLVPFASRDDLMRQIPGIKKLHESYLDYAQISSPKDIFNSSNLAVAKQLKAETLTSGIYWNQGDGKFRYEAFPIQAQFSPIHDFTVFEKKGETYLIGFGNFSGFRSDLGQALAAPLVMINFKDGALKAIDSNLDEKIWGEYRYGQPIQINGIRHLLGVRNNDAPVFWK
jgi:enediyne biosynthesis protein E4